MAACNAGEADDAGSIRGSGRSPGGGNGTPLLYSWATVHEVTNSRTSEGLSRDCSPPGSSVHGIPRARILEWVAISFLTQGLNSHLLCFLYSQVDSSLLSHQSTQLITCLSSLNFFHWKNSVNMGYSKINITNRVLLCSVLKLQTQETSEID